jgi:hypothetical protein
MNSGLTVAVNEVAGLHGKCSCTMNGLPGTRCQILSRPADVPAHGGCVWAVTGLRANAPATDATDAPRRFAVKGVQAFPRWAHRELVRRRTSRPANPAPASSDVRHSNATPTGRRGQGGDARWVRRWLRGKT